MEQEVHHTYGLGIRVVFPDDNADGSSGINPDLAGRKEAEIKSLELIENLPLA